MKPLKTLMSKRRSIFSKYFFICSAVILISFICLGAVLLLVSSRYFEGEKKDVMERSVRSLAEESRVVMTDSPSQWRESVSDGINEYSVGSDADFILINQSGSVIISPDYSSEYSDIKFTEDALDNFGAQSSYLFDDFDEAFDQPRYVAGISFEAEGQSYFLLAVSDSSQRWHYTLDVMKIFGMSAGIVIIIVLVIVYFTVTKLTGPVKEMAEASKEIRKGNFAVDLPSYNVREFEELSNALNDMAASLKNYDTMKNSFVANVSHELRTPMTSISGFVDGILDGTIPPEEENRYLKIISSEVHRLTRLVRSMLNLAKIEAGELKPNMQYFSVLEPIVDSFVTFENRLEEKHIEIRGLDIDRVTLYADRDLIHQVMYNLIENAIKFVNDGGYIEFGFKPVGNMTVISIKNSGDGLSEEELPLVFDRFYKTDKSRSLDSTGVGLGLNIVRSIIKLHNGKIMVRSVQGEYTEFVFTIPNKPKPVDE